MDFSRPSTLSDSAHIDSFNGILRGEFLNTNWFNSISEAARLAKLGGETIMIAGLTWLTMAKRRLNLPKYQACAMVGRSKSLLGSNA